jgi:hypothetical protein
MDSERQRHRSRKVALLAASGVVVAVLIGLWLMKLHQEEVDRAVRDARIAAESMAGPGETAAANAQADEDDRRRELERRENGHLLEPGKYEPLSKDESEELVALREREASRKK